MKENNKLIAEFMGFVESPTTNKYWTKRSPEGFGIGELVDLKFHTDWNWLMEVVQRITDLNNVVEIHDNHVRVVSNERNNALIDVVEGSMLEATYNACVEFIKLYNQKK